ncbi:MAG TPA: hypothetical protein VF748_12190 [Candidatus Acidoferrum sp.]
MGGMMGGGGGGKGGGGSGGVSDFAMQMIEQAVGENIQALQNRYKQLGLGKPSGDPLTAALGGTSLTYAGPSTMEAQDVANQQQIGQAAQGQIQVENVGNPFAPGSPANLAELASQQQQFQSASGSIAGARNAANAGGPGTGPGTGLSIPGGTSLTGTTGGGGGLGGRLDAGSPITGGLA